MVNIAALKIIADYIAKSFNIKVVFSSEANTAFTDLSTRIITLPTFIPDKLYDAVIGLIDHEAMHLKVTSLHQVPRGISKSKFNILNILEDIRINEILNKDYPNYITLISHFTQLVYKDPQIYKDYAAADKKSGTPSIQKTFSLVFYANNLIGMNAPDSFYEAFMKKKGFWDKLISEVKAAPDLSGIVKRNSVVNLPEYDSLLDKAYNEIYPQGPITPKPPTQPGKPPPTREPGDEPPPDEPGEPGEGKGEGEGKDEGPDEPGEPGEGKGEGKETEEQKTEREIYERAEQLIRNADKSKGYKRTI